MLKQPNVPLAWSPRNEHSSVVDVQVFASSATPEQACVSLAAVQALVGFGLELPHFPADGQLGFVTQQLGQVALGPQPVVALVSSVVHCSPLRSPLLQILVDVQQEPAGASGMEAHTPA